MVCALVLDCRDVTLFDSGGIWTWRRMTLFCDTAGIRVFGPVSGKTGRASAEAEATWHIVKAIPGPDEVVLRSPMC